MRKNMSVQTVRKTAGHSKNAQALLAATNGADKKVMAVGKQLKSAVGRAKVTLQAAQKKAVAGAKATDKTIRKHPYHAMGIALGVGAVAGLLLSRRGRKAAAAE